MHLGGCNKTIKIQEVQNELYTEFEDRAKIPAEAGDHGRHERLVTVDGFGRKIRPL